MKRRLAALLGLLSLTACNPDDIVTPPASTTGTVKGSLTPFRRSSDVGGGRPAMLREPAVRRQLSSSLSKALAARQGVKQSELAADGVNEAETIPGDVIVRFEEARLSEEDALARVQLPGYRAVHKGYISDYLHLIGYESRELRSFKVGETGNLVQRVGAMGGVRYAEKNVRVHSFKTPNDSYYARQWHYPAMNLPAAWDITTGSANLVTAVVDTGIVRHADLNDRVIQGADMISDATSAGDGDGRDNDPTDMGKDSPDGSSSWHGSHVAGTIGAVTNEGQGVAGVTWSGKILPVRVLGRGGGSFADIAAGIQWAVGRSVPGVRTNTNPAQVINMSLGGESSPSAALQEVINDAVKDGVVIVVAAGNSNIEGSRFSPCNQQNVICVGATRFNGKRASYSNYGSAVSVMATGGETAEDTNGDRQPDGVLSTILDGSNQPTWGYYQGTSMASPHVAGIVALMKSVVADPKTLDVTTVKQILQETAEPASKCAEGCGSGLVNAQAAVLRAKNGLNPDAPAKLGVGATQLSFTGNGTQQLTVRNQGGRRLVVTAAASGTNASALSFPSGNSLTLDGYKSNALSVAVSTAGLANGDYTAQFVLSGDNGEKASVDVKFRVGATADKDAVLAFAYLDLAKEWQIDESGVIKVSSASGYAYSLTLPPRTYYALATIDDDGDGEFFEDEDRVGVWRDITNFEPIPVAQGQTVNGISFALVPGTTEDLPDTVGIGGACTGNSDCDSGLCNTSFPQGYCTEDCISDGACPSGSTCYYTDSTKKAARCYADCTGTGTQGTCRTNYICSASTTGGACVPK